MLYLCKESFFLLLEFIFNIYILILFILYINFVDIWGFLNFFLVKNVDVCMRKKLDSVKNKFRVGIEEVGDIYE